MSILLVRDLAEIGANPFVHIPGDSLEDVLPSLSEDLANDLISPELHPQPFGIPFQKFNAFFQFSHVFLTKALFLENALKGLLLNLEVGQFPLQGFNFIFLLEDFFT